MDEMKQMMERIQKGDKPGRTGNLRTSKPEVGVLEICILFQFEATML